MTITVTDLGTATNTSGATLTFAIPAGGVPAGAAICVAVGERNVTAAGTLSDTKNNYVLITSALEQTNAGFAQLFVASNVAALTSANTLTYTKQTSGSATTLSVFYATGVAPSPVDAAVTAAAIGGDNLPTVTSGTPAVGGELFVAAVIADNAFASFTEPGSFVAPFTTNAPGASNQNVYGGNQVNAAATALTYNPSVGATSRHWAALIVGLRPAAVTSLSASIAATIALAWLAADPLPVMPQHLAALQTSVRNNPPFGHRGTTASTAETIALNQPTDWPYVYLRGGSQPYANGVQANLARLIINNPPLGHRGQTTLVQSEIIALNQPPDWPYVYQRGGRQPYALGQLAALTTSIRSNPPFGYPGAQALLFETVALSQPTDWPYVFMVNGRQPYERGPLDALATSVTNTPPGGTVPSIVVFEDPALPQSTKYLAQPFVAAAAQPYRYDLTPILSAWQPPDPLPTLPRNLAALSTSIINSPQPNLDEDTNLSVILSAWVQPDPLPTLPKLVNPAIPGRSVDNPPGIRVTVAIPAIDFTLPQQQRYLVPVQAVVQPPPATNQINTVLQWQPIDPLPTLPRNLAALSTSIINNPPLLRRVTLPVPEDVVPVQPRPMVPQQVAVAAQPFTPWWLNPVLAWQPADPLPTLPRYLAALSTSTVNNPPILGTGRSTLNSILSTAWLPPDPQPQTAPKFIFGLAVGNPLGGGVPLIVSFEDLPLPQLQLKIAALLATPPVVNNPPFGFKPFSWGYGDPIITSISGGELIQSVDNPPFIIWPWYSNIWTAWEQPFQYPQVAPKLIQPGAAPPAVNNPPAGSTPLIVVFDDPALPQTTRYLVQPVVTVQFPFSRDLSGILTSWQPPDWMLQTRRLLAALSTSTVNNPPLRKPQAAPGVWPDPDVPPQLAYKLPPSLIAVRVDNPPFIIQARYSNIYTAWEPLPPLPQRGPFIVIPGVTPPPVTELHYRQFFVTFGKMGGFCDV